MKKILLLLLVSLFLASSIQASDNVGQLVKELGGITSPDDVVRGKSLIKLDEERYKVLSEASGIFRRVGKKRRIIEDSETHYAVRVLASWKHLESTRLFLNHIDLRVEPKKGSYRLKRDAGWQFPCALALTRLGGFSLLKTISNKISEEASEDKIKIFTWVLYRLLSKDLCEVFLDMEEQKHMEGSVQSERLLKAKTYALEGDNVLRTIK
ncbi:hypothetical protein ACFL2A_06505 [Thermodesulfobacteriota bacterium]